MKDSTAIVADDHEVFRVALSAMLRDRLGFALVLTAESLDGALELLATTDEAGLVLLDLGMPGMKGAAGVAAVRECRPDVRVAVVSGSDDPQDIADALAAGVHGFVPKTLGIDAMTGAIRDVWGGGAYLPALSGPLPLPSRPRPSPSLPALTERQRQVLGYLVEGRSNKEIARALNLGEGTVKIHLSGLLRALGVNNRAQAAVAGAAALAPTG